MTFDQFLEEAMARAEGDETQRAIMYAMVLLDAWRGQR